jgi:CheY-like chemotaxis protein
MSNLQADTPVALGLNTMAVLDDDAVQAKAVKLQLEEIGVETVIADLDRVPTLERAIDWVLEHAQAAVCDVQLNHLHSGVNYDGAQLLSSLIGDHAIPGVLTTGFKDDVGMCVRPHRWRIPVLVSRDETEEPEVLLEGVEICRKEMANGRAPDRETHRVALFIEKTATIDNRVALDARVGGWSQKASIRFPASMLGEQYDNIEAARAIVDHAFFAHVNLGAEHETDLFFESPESELVDPSELPLHFGPAQR